MFLGTAAKFLAAHRFYGKNGFHEIPRAEMPAGFPDIAVDTKFYVRALYRQDRRLRRYSALGRAAEQVAELRRRVSTIAEP